MAIVVPARDETEVVTSTLPTLLSQRYPGPVRVILVDDSSADGTAETALMTLDSARRHWSGRGSTWKGRSDSPR